MELPEFINNNINPFECFDKKPIIVYSNNYGKRTITKVRELPFTKYEILKQLKFLKKILNCNGTFKNNELLFLGEHKNYIYEYYKKLGFEVIKLP
jgi:translation initiation factor 1 (eIF-1/SUI1)